MIYLKEIKKKLINSNVKLYGCTEEEIIEIQNIAGKKLPKCFIEFLEIMGKGTEADRSKPNWYFDYSGFEGNAVFYEDLFDNKEDGLLELLEEDSREDLIKKITENEFVFYDSQGVLQAFFKLDEGDNPPVYGYSQGYEGEYFPKIADSLLGFYNRYLENDETLFLELRD